jgi:virginiamycin A acetyltransferase
MTKCIADLLFKAYARQNHRVRRVILSLVTRFDGGELYSTLLRRIFRHYHSVDIGMYSMGGCFDPYRFDPKTSLGRYCSIARSARVLRGNHPMNFKSMHGFFFDPALKFCDSFLAEFNPLEIGNDVWLGEGSIIMPNVRRIGDGAVVAAGAVVNKDVPPYAIVVGNPARVVRFRFSQEKIKELLASRWWEKSVDELRAEKADFIKPLEIEAKEDPSA